MPYRQKLQNSDIRTLNLRTSEVATEAHTLIPLDVKLTNLPTYRVKKEVAHIILSCAPLLTALVIATYFEETSPWVILLAEWAMKLGA